MDHILSYTIWLLRLFLNYCIKCYYAGCMWSVSGVHDHGWTERAVFGKVRYISYDYCRRRFDVDAFVDKYGGKKHKYIAAKQTRSDNSAMYSYFDLNLIFNKISTFTQQLKQSNCFICNILQFLCKNKVIHSQEQCTVAEICGVHMRKISYFVQRDERLLLQITNQIVELRKRRDSNKTLLICTSDGFFILHWNTSFIAILKYILNRVLYIFLLRFDCEKEYFYSYTIFVYMCYYSYCVNFLIRKYVRSTSYKPHIPIMPFNGTNVTHISILK